MGASRPTQGSPLSGELRHSIIRPNSFSEHPTDDGHHTGQTSRDAEAHEQEALFEQDSEQQSSHGNFDDKASSRSPSSDSRRPPNFLGIWWLETLACALSIVALLALFGTLYHYQNRPSPRWPRWMSLNTIVSIFVVALKTGVVLVLGEGIGQLKWSWFAKSTRPLEHLQIWDSATRGPVGAGVLLKRLGMRDLLASFGDRIIILALAVDPSAQQTIHYRDCTITTPGAANLPRENNYAIAGGAHAGALERAVLPGVQQAINAGIFNPTPYPSFECSTGNCTWPTEYSSAAWCSTCQDIADQLVVTNTSHFVFDDTSSNGTRYLGYMLTTSVPGGISVNVPSMGPFWQYAAMGSAPGFQTVNMAASSIDYIIGAKDRECEDPYFASRWPCNGPAGTRCSLFPCVKTFNASVAIGHLTEKLVDRGWIWGNASFGGSMLDIKCLNQDELLSLQHLGYEIDQGQRYLAYNMPRNVNWTKIDDTFPTSLALHDCLYTTDISTEYSMADYFQSLLNGTVTGFIPTNSTSQGYFTGSQIVQTFFNFGNATFDSIQDVFANISISLTNYIREDGSNGGSTEGPVSSTPAQGTVHQAKICIGVRWAWLAYPIALVVLTLVFFVLLLVETWPKATHPKVWKSSPLALLFHGLAKESSGDSKEDELEDLNEVRGMEATAKSTAVKLEMSDSGLIQLVTKQSVMSQSE